MAKIAGVVFFFSMMSAVYSFESKQVVLDKGNLLKEAKELQNIAITADGMLAVAPTVETVSAKELELISSFLPVSGTFLGGTNEGKIFSIKKTGQVDFEFDTKELLITSFVKFGSMIFASTIPNGKIYVKKGNEWSLFVQIPSKYVWKLYSKDKKLYAVCGLPAALYELSADGSVNKLLESEKVANFLSILIDGNSVLLGSSDAGHVYKFKLSDPTNLELINEFRGTDIIDILKLGTDVVIAANKSTSWQSFPVEFTPSLGKEDIGTIWRISDKTIEPLLSFPVFVNDIEESGGGVLVSLNSTGRLFLFRGTDRCELITSADTGSITAISKDDNTVYFCGSRRSIIGELTSRASESGVYFSKVFDTGFVSRLGSLQLDGVGRITVQIRTGNVADPDETWGVWSSPVDANMQNVSVSNGRYVQLRINLLGKDSKLERASLSYKNLNRRPLITKFDSLVQNNPMGGRQINLSWTVEDADKDSLSYSVYYRLENSKNWYSLSDLLTTNVFMVNTRDLPEGGLIFKLEASDHLSNHKDDTLTAESVTSRVTVDNTCPKLTFHFSGGKLSGYAEDSLTNVSLFMYQIDGGSWISFTSVDALLDSRREEFEIDVSLSLLDKGTHRIVVKATDGHGNSTLVGKSFVTK
ncbi:MAG: hypothetical protein HY606_07100 [Planctomycetes bacterium]|nr:hypothetical protein [Planctomycetota bacterium]